MSASETLHSFSLNGIMPGAAQRFFFSIDQISDILITVDIGGIIMRPMLFLAIQKAKQYKMKDNIPDYRELPEEML